MRLIPTFVAAVIAVSAWGADPMSTDYTVTQCLGSALPYPVPTDSYELPDSLTPVMINHVGRHGARYPVSPKATMKVIEFLSQAQGNGTITKRGEHLLELANKVYDLSHNHWGDLDSIGFGEQVGIASRMFMRCPMLFNDTRIQATATYVPRCVMSMDAFTHALTRLNNHVEIYYNSGRQNDEMLRPFEVNEEYLNWRRSKATNKPYREYCNRVLDPKMITSLSGGEAPADWQNLLVHCYKVVTGCRAMGLKIDPTEYFSREELNAIWSCVNLDQYLVRCKSTISDIPSAITSPLLTDILSSLTFAVEGRADYDVILRFGHAETLMPLTNQLQLPGCYYLTNYFDTVGQHWCNFDVAPMAANLQFILARAPSGNYYLVTLLNEHPVRLVPGTATVVTPWAQASAWFEKCLSNSTPAW